jgi:hypothetical protein
MEWISVKDKLPEIDESVLVTDGTEVTTGGYGHAVYRRQNKKCWYMDNKDWDGMPAKRDITHWMPIPEPPKKETV